MLVCSPLLYGPSICRVCPSAMQPLHVGRIAVSPQALGNYALLVSSVAGLPNQPRVEDPMFNVANQESREYADMKRVP